MNPPINHYQRLIIDTHQTFKRDTRRLNSRQSMQTTPTTTGVATKSAQHLSSGSKQYHVQRDEWYCTPCDIFCNSQLQFDVHLISQKHANANALTLDDDADPVEKSQGDEFVDTAENEKRLNALIVAKFNVHASQYLIPKEKRHGKYEKFGFHCALCDSYMTGLIQLVMHVKGAKHYYFSNTDSPRIDKLPAPRKLFGGRNGDPKRRQQLATSSSQAATTTATSLLARGQRRSAMHAGYHDYLLKNQALMQVYPNANKPHASTSPASSSAKTRSSNTPSPSTPLTTSRTVHHRAYPGFNVNVPSSSPSASPSAYSGSESFSSSPTSHLDHVISAFDPPADTSKFTLSPATATPQSLDYFMSLQPQEQHHDLAREYIVMQQQANTPHAMHSLGLASCYQTPPPLTTAHHYTNSIHQSAAFFMNRHPHPFQFIQQQSSNSADNQIYTASLPPSQISSPYFLYQSQQQQIY